MMQRRWVNRLLLAGGVLLAAVLWELLLLYLVYDDPLAEPWRVVTVLVLGAAVGTWYGPARRTPEEHDWLWAGAMVERGLLLAHLWLVPWAVLQAPLLGPAAGVVLALLGWVLGAILRRWCAADTVAFRPVHGLMLFVAGLIAALGYLVHMPAPLFCRSAGAEPDVRTLFAWTDSCPAGGGPGLCALPAARIEHIAVSAAGRFLVGTAEQDGRAGLFRLRLDGTGEVVFLPLEEARPRGMLPFDHGRSFLVPTDSLHNALLLVSVDPFIVTRRAALVPDEQAIELGTAVLLDPGRLLLLPTSGTGALEVNLTTWRAEPREVPIWDPGLVPRYRAVADGARDRLFVTTPLSPYIDVAGLIDLQPQRDLSAGLLPTAVAVEPLRRRIYTADYLLGRVQVRDADTLLERGWLPLGFSVHQLATAPDGSSLAGACLATGQVVQVGLASEQPIEIWRLGRLTRALHWSPVTGKLYAASRCGVFELTPVPTGTGGLRSL